MSSNKIRYNGSREAIIIKRRMAVEQATLRGRSIREVAVVLAENGFVNPDTGEPYHYTTLHRDLKHLEAKWQKNADQSIEKRKAKILAEIDELKRVGWQDKELNLILNAIKRECDVCGIDAPKQHDVFGSGGDFNLTIKRREQKEKDAGE